MNNKQLFLKYLAQTSDFPLMLEIEKAKGIYLYAKNKKKYIDVISGISVSNVGHNHPKVIKAIKDQADKYLHLMVYGEYVQSPQIQLAKKLISLLPDKLNKIYYVNSGSEAVEGAIKLAKKYTGKKNIISFRNSYHGSTIGALSVSGAEVYKRNFLPLLPNCFVFEYNDPTVADFINEETACVLVEPIQAEAGIIEPQNEFLSILREKCNKTGTLLIFDEIQTAIGRTGKLFAFEKYNVIPDILLLAKSFGGGLPLGAFISSEQIMNSLKKDPPLGHITTFGGNPLCCAAALASLNIITKEKIINNVLNKSILLKNILSENLQFPIRSAGLLMAIDFGSPDLNMKIIKQCLNNGLVTDWFLFNKNSMRIAPPLTISKKEIHLIAEIIIKSVNQTLKKK